MQPRALIAVVTIAMLMAFACSSEDDGDDVAATTTGSGGAGAGAATTSTGGTMEPECPHTGDPVLNPTSLPACEGHATCRCLNAALIPEESRDSFSDCDDTNKCVPDTIIASGGNFIPKTCASIGGFEGRCLNECLPAVAGQADVLPQGICEVGEKCVPCFDPFDQTETGACEQSCDPGPANPPGMFPRCCQDGGSCVAAADVPADQVDNLKRDNCSDADDLCIPDGVADGSYVAQACTTSIIILGGDEYGPGACLHDCLAAVDMIGIVQDDCPDGFKCAPCLDPVNVGEETGACDFLP